MSHRPHRAMLALSCAVLATAALAACGGSGSGADNPSGSASNGANDSFRFAHCMREHGVQVEASTAGGPMRIAVRGAEKGSETSLHRTGIGVARLQEVQPRGRGRGEAHAGRKGRAGGSRPEVRQVHARTRRPRRSPDLDRGRWLRGQDRHPQACGRGRLRKRPEPGKPRLRSGAAGLPGPDAAPAGRREGWSVQGAAARRRSKGRRNRSTFSTGG